jgi:hypothetical protein
VATTGYTCDVEREYRVILTHDVYKGLVVKKYRNNSVKASFYGDFLVLALRQADPRNCAILGRSRTELPAALIKARQPVGLRLVKQSAS